MVPSIHFFINVWFLLHCTIFIVKKMSLIFQCKDCVFGFSIYNYDLTCLNDKIMVWNVNVHTFLCKFNLNNRLCKAAKWQLCGNSFSWSRDYVPVTICYDIQHWSRFIYLRTNFNPFDSFIYWHVGGSCDILN